MKSLTEQQLREMLHVAYRLGASHITDAATETIKGTQSPAAQLRRAQEAQETFDKLIKNC